MLLLLRSRPRRLSQMQQTPERGSKTADSTARNFGETDRFGW
jgi:hypothetical protein